MNVIEVTLVNTGFACYIVKDEISAFYDFQIDDSGVKSDHCVISLKSGMNFTTIEKFDTIKELLLGK